jgi:hypothetical protein
VRSTHGRTNARTHGIRTGGRRGTSPHRLFRASVLLCVCASVLACTDPRARPAPPSVRLIIPPGVIVRSPGTIAASVVIFDAEGVDSIHMTLQSPYPSLQGDSLYLVPDTTDVTQSVLWSVPSGVPAGTKITLGAKAWDLLGFTAADSAIVTSQ